MKLYQNTYTHCKMPPSVTITHFISSKKKKKIEHEEKKALGIFVL